MPGDIDWDGFSELNSGVPEADLIGWNCGFPPGEPLKLSLKPTEQLYTFTSFGGSPLPECLEGPLSSDTIFSFPLTSVSAPRPVSAPSSISTGSFISALSVDRFDASSNSVGLEASSSKPATQKDLKKRQTTRPGKQSSQKKQKTAQPPKVAVTFQRTSRRAAAVDATRKISSAYDATGRERTRTTNPSC